jgi:phospholipid/cholesterol/gamma-HCH transport system permease protein
VKRAISDLGQKVIDATTAIGQATLLTIETLVWMVRPPYRFRLLFQAMEFVGVGSLFIVLLTGLFTARSLPCRAPSPFASSTPKVSSVRPWPSRSPANSLPC